MGFAGLATSRTNGELPLTIIPLSFQILISYQLLVHITRFEPPCRHFRNRPPRAEVAQTKALLAKQEALLSLAKDVILGYKSGLNPSSR
jgi:hypothetical protein